LETWEHRKLFKKPNQPSEVPVLENISNIQRRSRQKPFFSHLARLPSGDVASELRIHLAVSLNSSVRAGRIGGRLDHTKQCYCNGTKTVGIATHSPAFGLVMMFVMSVYFSYKTIKDHS
jgi:hypothetical protein